MFMKVVPELCTGCYGCRDVCRSRAITIIDALAVIDDSLCTRCGACVRICPNNAIKEYSSLPVQKSGVVIDLPMTNNNLEPTQNVRSEHQALSRSLGSIAGSSLAFLGREVAPRLIDVLGSVLEQKLTQPTRMNEDSSCDSRNNRGTSRGLRRQARIRAGRYRNRNS